MKILSVLRIITALLFALTTPAVAAPTHKPAHHTHHKKHISHHWHGYGFLPGYRPPEVIERERAAHYWSTRPDYYGPAFPRYYHGRWNGGGFGPCYTSTPIGYMWNCGR